MRPPTSDWEVLFENAEMTLRLRDDGIGHRELALDAGAALDIPRRRSITTSYPPALVQAVIRTVGPAWAIDEISRDEDAEYVAAYLHLDLPAYVSVEEFGNARILDFGCGAGASTLILNRMFPDADIVGVELSPKSLALARARQAFYDADNIAFLRSPAGDRLPEHIGSFDLVVMSAVLEHVLPEERDPILHTLWSVLRPGGALIIDQTPHRWFPIESHSTLLPLLNYMPRSLARRMAYLSPRVRRGTPWEQLLREGVRGATSSEVVCRLQRTGNGVERLTPCLAGVGNEVELWYRGPSFEGYGWIKPAWHRAAQLIYRLSGRALVPYLSVGFRKTRP
jgi:SAM-dependent methyltransferase